MNTLTIKLCSAFFITALLSACGGSSGSSGGGNAGITYNGNTAPAEIDDSNAKSIGEAAGESVLQASSSSALPGAFETVKDIDLNPVHEFIIQTSQSLTNLPASFDVDVSKVCTGGGSASVSSSGTRSVITYRKCSFSGGYTINGTVVMNDTSSGFSMSYQNVTLSGVSADPVTLNYTITCSNRADFSTCTTSSVFQGSDGQTHQVSDYEITGSSSSGYNGTASFNHYSYGNVSVTVTGITYGNCNSMPDGGSISFSSTNGSSGTINFNSDCSVSGTWTDGVVSGSF